MLDTDTCIYLIRKKSEKALKKVEASIGVGLAISVITLAELEHGVKKSGNPGKNAKALAQMLIPIDVLDFSPEAAAVYGVIRSGLEAAGCVIGQMDMLIAAHAKAKGMTIVTNNEKEFRRVEGLVVENWI